MVEVQLDISRTADFVLALARQAGALLRERFSSGYQVDHKGGRELVTEVDMASEQLIVTAIQERFPDHTVEAEEGSGQEQASVYRWFIDPLDGTNNYAHGYPHFCVSIALWQDNMPYLGVVCDPVRDECYLAIRGEGAFLNGRPIQVSTIDKLAASVVSTGFPYDRANRPDNNVSEFIRVVPEVQGIRRSGVAALDLCYVAAGRQEAHWELGLKPWDVAAGGLVVLEAGGRATGTGGRPWDIRNDRLIASNGLVHKELTDLLGWF
jgi:myo-inositol-1(or 4)-monophosphatase